MLTISQLRQSAALSGMRDINSIEIEVILTHLLQLFNECGLSKHLAFKEGHFSEKWFLGQKVGFLRISTLPAIPISASMTLLFCYWRH